MDCKSNFHWHFHLVLIQWTHILDLSLTNIFTKSTTTTKKDTHPEELTTTAFAQKCHDLFANEPTVSIEEIAGTELSEKGYGGIYNVGKGATEPPRLVMLKYDPAPPSEKERVALIGKGIVYDTGGLAIKSKSGMCGMKSDMGGAAGVREYNDSYIFVGVAVALIVRRD